MASLGSVIVRRGSVALPRSALERRPEKPRRKRPARREKQRCWRESSAGSAGMTFFFDCTVPVREESSQRTVVIARPMATVRRPSFTELRPCGLRAVETPRLVEAADRAGKVVRISVAQRRQRTRATRDDLLRNALRPNEVICIEYVRTSIHKGVIFRVVKIHRRKEK
jgi:hypothetical protein